MNFPRYTREENKSCKLKDSDILEIKERREKKETYKSIARDYGVTEQCIAYWCLDEKTRKERNKKQDNTQRTKFDYDAYRERKKLLHPELKDYEIIRRKKTLEEKPEEAKVWIKKSTKVYWEKHKEERMKKNKEYQRKNLDKYREYNRRSREKKKNSVIEGRVEIHK